MSKIQLNNHYNLNKDEDYKIWRDKKLQVYPMTLGDIVVELKDPKQLTPSEKSKMDDIMDKTNMVIYTSHYGDSEDKDIVRRLGAQFGVTSLDHNECADDDAITSLQINKEGLHDYYIPYSNKPISWHTDGYYNRLDEQIYALLLHCVRPAASGGENELMDAEIAYILLRDENPDYITALMQDDAFTIPKNVIDGELIRPDRSGPVFMFDENQKLHMRYSARQRNAIWKDDEITLAAEQALRKIMQDAKEYILKGTLDSGMGLVSRNVLHTRSAFDEPNESARLLYRGRYFDKIA